MGNRIYNTFTDAYAVDDRTGNPFDVRLPDAEIFITKEEEHTAKWKLEK